MDELTGRPNFSKIKDEINNELDNINEDDPVFIGLQHFHCMLVFYCSLIHNNFEKVTRESVRCFTGFVCALYHMVCS